MFYSQYRSTNEAMDHNWGRGVSKVEEVQIRRSFAVQFEDEMGIGSG